MIRLILTVEDEKGRRFAYAAKESPVLIGRSASADLRLGEPRVGLFHARVTFDEMHATFEDLSSPSGSTKNGRRLEAGKPVSILDDTPVSLAGGFRLTASWGEVDDARPEHNPFAVGPARDADAEIAALSPAAAVARAERLSGRGTGDGKGRIGFGGAAAASANSGKTLFMAAAPRFELPKGDVAKPAETAETAGKSEAAPPSGTASPRQTPSLAMKLAPPWTPSSSRQTPSLAAKLAPPWVPSSRPATPSLPVSLVPAPEAARPLSASLTSTSPSAAAEVTDRARRLSPSPGVPSLVERERSDKSGPAASAMKERTATPTNGNGKSGNDSRGAETDASLRKTRIGRMASGTDSGPTAATVNRSHTVATTPASGVVTVGGPDSGRVADSGPAKTQGASDPSSDPRLAGAPTLLGAPALQFPLPGRAPSASPSTKGASTPVTGTPTGAASSASAGSRSAMAPEPEPVAEAKPSSPAAPADAVQAARDPQSLSALAKPVERLERRSRDPHVDGAEEARRQTRLLIVVFLVTLVTVFGIGAWLVQKP